MYRNRRTHETHACLGFVRFLRRAENLNLTRQRYEAGVTDNVEVVQSQESVAGAELDYINSVFAHNVAKLSLARALGQAADNLAQFLQTR